MRNIKLSKWTAKTQDGKEVEENVLDALNILISNKRPEELPKGLDNFRLFNRLSKAFDKAKESGTLTLEEIDYKFLKDTIVKDIPSVWAMNKNINQAIEDFLEAKDG